MPYSMNAVMPNLWIGAELPARSAITKYFDVLVLAAKEIGGDSTKYPGVRIIRVPLDDNGKPPTAQEVYQARKAGIEVAKQMAMGKMVLSTCHLGKNRSGLIAALALRNLGWSADRAIRAVRDARGKDALSNEWFQEILKES